MRAWRPREARLQVGDPLLLKRPGPRIAKAFPLARISMLFPAPWTDPTESSVRAPRDMPADGSWARLSDPIYRGGNNKLYGDGKRALVRPKPWAASTPATPECPESKPSSFSTVLVRIVTFIPIECDRPHSTPYGVADTIGKADGLH